MFFFHWKGTLKGHLITFSPLERHPRGHFTTLSPLERHSPPVLPWNEVKFSVPSLTLTEQHYSVIIDFLT